MDKQEAIKILKEFHDKSALFSVRTALETVLPELKESEDEKIRKEIIGLVEYTRGRRIGYNPRVSQDEMIAWLKKQEDCEHIKKEWLEHIKYSGGTSKEWTISDAATFKELIDFLENGTAKLQHDITRYANWLKIQLAPKVKPKFNVGEWITNSIETVQITDYDIDYGYQVDYKGNLQHRDALNYLSGIEIIED